MIQLARELESTFDPSDTDAAMQLAYLSLRLAQYAWMAVLSDNQNQLLGRDLGNRLAVAIDDVGRQLGLLSCHASGAEIEPFRDRLKAEL